MNRRMLAELISRRLCSILLERLHSNADPTLDYHVSSPVRMQISVNQHELLDWVNSPESNSAMVPPSLLSRVDEAIHESGARQLILEGQLVNSHTQPQESPTGRSFHSDRSANGRNQKADPFRKDALNEVTTPTGDNEVKSLFSFLVTLLKTGKLSIFLSRLSATVISLWHTTLMRELGIADNTTQSGAPQDGDDPRGISDVAHAKRQTAHDAPSRNRLSDLESTKPSLASILKNFARMANNTNCTKTTKICRIMAICEIVSNSSTPSESSEIVSVLDYLFPIVPARTDTAGNNDQPERQNCIDLSDCDGTSRRMGKGENSLTTNDSDTAQNGTDNSPTGNDGSAVRTIDNAGVASSKHSELKPKRLSVSDFGTEPFRGEIVCASALPFIMLGPLARAGYFDLLNIAATSAGAGKLLPAFGAALALKIGAEPKRGWLHNEDSKTVARALAGGLRELPTHKIQQLSEFAESFCSPLDVHLSNLLLDDEQKLQTLHASQFKIGNHSKILLSDSNGHFPVAILDEFRQLDQLLLPHQDRVLLTSSESMASTDTLAQIDACGLRVVIATSPGRGKEWRRVLGANDDEFWTNDNFLPPPQIRRAGMSIADSLEASELFWHSIVNQRKAIPLAESPILENSLSLAAGVSLAQISYELWGNRDDTDATLAIDRLGDLSCRVEFREDSIKVMLPLGQRTADLSSANLLADIPNVPWFDRRTIQFRQG